MPPSGEGGAVYVDRLRKLDVFWLAVSGPLPEAAPFLRTGHVFRSPCLA
jgi:hypothetical protein